MRFIDVTRYGGVKTLRLSVSAIAYVDGCEGGAVIRLIGGESLRVNEDPETIEGRCVERPKVVAIEAGDKRVEFEDTLPERSARARKGKSK